MGVWYWGLGGEMLGNLPLRSQGPVSVGFLRNSEREGEGLACVLLESGSDLGSGDGKKAEPL